MLMCRSHNDHEKKNKSKAPCQPLQSRSSPDLPSNAPIEHVLRFPEPTSKPMSLSPFISRSVPSRNTPPVTSTSALPPEAARRGRISAAPSPFFILRQKRRSRRHENPEPLLFLVRAIVRPCAQETPEDGVIYDRNKVQWLTVVRVAKSQL